VCIAPSIVLGNGCDGKTVVSLDKAKRQAEAQGFARGGNGNEALPVKYFWLRIQGRRTP
jgi:hypothetical protein